MGSSTADESRRKPRSLPKIPYSFKGDSRRESQQQCMSSITSTNNYRADAANQLLFAQDPSLLRSVASHHNSREPIRQSASIYDYSTYDHKKRMYTDPCEGRADISGVNRNNKALYKTKFDEAAAGVMITSNSVMIPNSGSTAVTTTTTTSKQRSTRRKKTRGITNCSMITEMKLNELESNSLRQSTEGVDPPHIRTRTHSVYLRIAQQQPAADAARKFSGGNSFDVESVAPFIQQSTSQMESRRSSPPPISNPQLRRSQDDSSTNFLHESTMSSKPLKEQKQQTMSIYEERKKKQQNEAKVSEMFFKMEEEKELQFHPTKDVIRVVEKVIDQIDQRAAMSRRKKLFEKGHANLPPPTNRLPIPHNNSIQKSSLIQSLDRSILEEHINEKLDALQLMEESKYKKRYEIAKKNMEIDISNRRNASSLSGNSNNNNENEGGTRFKNQLIAEQFQPTKHVSVPAASTYLKLPRKDATLLYEPIRKKSNNGNQNRVNSLLSKIFAMTPSEFMYEGHPISLK